MTDRDTPLDVGGLAEAAAATSWARVPAEVRARVVELAGDVLAVTAFGSAAPSSSS